MVLTEEYDEEILKASKLEESADMETELCVKILGKVALYRKRKYDH